MLTMFRLVTTLGFMLMLSLSQGEAAITAGVTGGVPQIFVATTGNDSTGHGTIDSPYATPAKAQAAVETLISGGTTNAHVWLRGGTYRLGSTLALTSADGPVSGRVIWASYPTENAILSGGIQVTGWMLCMTADSVCNSGSNGVYQSSVTSPSNFREAYFGGIHGIRSRGAAFPIGWSVTSAGVYTAPSNSTTPTSSWTNVSDIEIISQQGWQTNYCPILSISGTTVDMQTPCITNWASNFYTQIFIGNATPAWVENAYELLPTCGQGCWYYNTVSQILYYIPRTGENMSTLDVEVPSLTQILTGNDVANVTFSRLSVEYSTWLGPSMAGLGFVEIQAGYSCPSSGTCRTGNGIAGNILPGAIDFSGGSNNVTFNHNLFAHLAGRPLLLEHGTQSVTVYANLFTDDAGGGLQVGDVTDYAQSNAALQTASITVKNNEVDAPFEYLSSSGIFMPIARNSIITNNYVRDSPWAAISTGWWGWYNEGGGHSTYNTGNTVSNNQIVDACQNWPLEDCGDIYNNGANPTLSVIGNYDLGLGGNSTNYKKACYYPDEASVSTTWNGNVCDGPLTTNSCSTGGSEGGCFLFMWENGINNNTVTGNYVTSTLYLDNGTGNTVSGNTLYTHGNPPTGAIAIINAAGIESGVTPGP